VVVASLGEVVSEDLILLDQSFSYRIFALRGDDIAVVAAVRAAGMGMLKVLTLRMMQSPVLAFSSYASPRRTDLHVLHILDLPESVLLDMAAKRLEQILVGQVVFCVVIVVAEHVFRGHLYRRPKAEGSRVLIDRIPCLPLYLQSAAVRSLSLVCLPFLALSSLHEIWLKLLHCAFSFHLLVLTLPEHLLVFVLVPKRYQLSYIDNSLHLATLAAFLAAVDAADVLGGPASLVHIVVYSAGVVFVILQVVMAGLECIVHNLWLIVQIFRVGRMSQQN
jgi:hypothetical protein